MVKLTNELRQQIIKLLNDKKPTGVIMDELHVSRSMVQRIRNDNKINELDNDIEVDIHKSNIEEIEDEEINELFDNINKQPIHKQPTEPIQQRPTERPIQQQSTERPKIDVFDNIEGKINLIDKLGLDDNKPINKSFNQPSFNQPSFNQQVQQVKQHIPRTINIGIDEDHIEKRNLSNKIKLYIDSFTDKLHTIHGGDPITFKHRLRELNVDQLKILLQNIQFEINAPSGQILFNHAFFVGISQFESLSCSYNYDIKGLSEMLKQDQNVNDSLKELSCQIDLSAYTTPEMRLLSSVLLCTMSVYNNNKLSKKMNDFLNEEIPENIEEKYKDL